MIYDVDYFIRKFEAIPEAKWCTGEFINADARCANGHCLAYRMGIDNNPELVGLIAVFDQTALHNWNNAELIKISFPHYSHKASCINDGMTSEYQQPTPKQRILAALYDIKKLQTKDIDTGAKRERIVYVAVPETIKEQASELIMQ